MEQDDPGVYHHLVGFEGDWRDGWHNEDFIALMAERWGLAGVRRALDVGCGVGHWGLRLARYMPEQAVLVGVDREASFLEGARERAAERGLQARSEWIEGTATELAFESDTFDFVTCQTVLIHLPDPAAALREMVRVLKPGGILGVVEPSNTISTLSGYLEQSDLPLDDVLTIVRFQVIAERGKIAMGGGNNSIAHELPDLLAGAGLQNIRAHHSDRCALARPPYDRSAQLDVAMRLKWSDEEAAAGGTKADTRARFLAGGGSEAEFDHAWALIRRQAARESAAMRAGTWKTAGIYCMVHVSGHKPQA